MWHSRFFGTLLAVLALLSFMESQTALAAYPTALEFSMSQPQEIRGLDGSFQLAVMGNSAVPMNIPPEGSPEKVQPAKPAVEKPKATPKKEPQKASKLKKKKVKKANVKKAPAKKPVKEEGSFLTKTLKILVGGDTKNEKKDKKNILSPINMAPTGSSAQKKEEEQPRTAKSETKKTLKDSFEKLIGMGAVNDEGDSQSTKADKPAREIKSAKKEESGGLLGGILGSSKKKKDPPATKQAKAEDTVEKQSTPPKPKRITARKYIEEEEQLEKDRGGVKKGKNVLKESFKTLIANDKKKEE